MAVADMCNVILYITFTKDPYSLQLYYRYCSLMIKADSGRKAITEAELADVHISQHRLWLAVGASVNRYSLITN
jgi:hypothetical protein